MPRQARFTIENGTYHIMMRGNNKAKIFQTEDDFFRFKEIVKVNKEKYGLQIYHYVFMDNHVHFIIQAKDGKCLGNSIKRINMMYAQYYRRTYGGIGHFFQDRFKSYIIENGKYLLECGRYIELNPVRAGKVKEIDKYYWSSYNVYGKGMSDKIVDINPEYENMGNNQKSRQMIYKEYIMDGLKERRKEERFFKEGVYGSSGFRKELEKKGLKIKWSHAGQPKKVLPPSPFFHFW